MAATTIATLDCSIAAPLVHLDAVFLRPTAIDSGGQS